MTAFGRVPDAPDVATISGRKEDRIIHNIYRMFQHQRSTATTVLACRLVNP